MYYVYVPEPNLFIPEFLKETGCLLVISRYAFYSISVTSTYFLSIYFSFTRELREEMTIFYNEILWYFLIDKSMWENILQVDFWSLKHYHHFRDKTILIKSEI